jgi:ABC-type multidrug transport system fused ATPase/permease subunit
LFVAGNTASLSTVYGSIQKTRGAAGRIFEIIDREPAIGGGAGGAGPTHKESRVAVGVQFEQVGFRYPAREDFVVLDGMDLELPAGTHTAIVGHSGCGKSTVASLLLRLYDVTSGTVKVGGKDVKDLPTDELRDMIAVVQQEPVLFGGSIRENIAYGRSDASEEDVLVAARAAKVTDFVETFPEGLDTIVGERGVRLSGGQKQRVAVARVLLRQAPVVIFDEATSALDAESEFAVTKAIESLVRDRTVVSIAHRLSTIRMADRVAVLEGGKVVEIIEDVGALDEEMLRGRGDSPFANLIRRQLSKEPSN